MTMVKQERLQLRIDEDAKRRLEDAAAAVHLSTTAFVLQAAALRADEVLAERSQIALSQEAALVLATALTEPPRVNERLKAALDRPRGFRWLD